MSYLAHIGTPRHSGRYPWGSGDNPYQRGELSFNQVVNMLKKEGFTELERAQAMGLKTTSDLRAKLSLEKASQWTADSARAMQLRADGNSPTEIGRIMGKNESQIRNFLNPEKQANAKKNEATIEMLKREVADKTWLDVGRGVELSAGVSRVKMNTAIAALKQEGYSLFYMNIPQLGTGKMTSMRVLVNPDDKSKEGVKQAYKDMLANKDQIRTITNWTEDGGETWRVVQDPVSLDSKRVMVRFGDDEPSGSAMDGVIQLRRGVADLSLGDSRYAQVRIAVDDKYYMKGMAIYSDNMPAGVDVVYNSNKNSSVGKLGAMKKMNERVDLEDGGSIYLDKNGKQKLNEFGATIRQKTYLDKNGKELLSPLNSVGFQGKEGSGEEGSWGTWSKTLSSQFLSKQTVSLAKKQLQLSLDFQKDEFDTIMSYTNPAVRQRLLDSFADDCDSKAVNLKAAALPRQGSKVILPLTSLKENECYSTMYKQGEKLVLIRYPHAGTFELPVVTNNKNNKEGKSVLGNAEDAIGIHPATAARLSGADFDGDTVITIPYTKSILTSKALTGLKDFDPKVMYPKTEGMPVMTAKQRGNEMGKVSNLITDMTIKGAPASDIVKAVRHSMVVIDAEKHELNYKQSYKDNDIAALKVKYQGGTLSRPRGASTLISRASSEQRVDERRPIRKSDIENDPSLSGVVRRAGYSVDPKTGAKVTVRNEDNAYINPKTGKLTYRQTLSSKMYETDNAYTLSSGTDMEAVYADYANSMKSLGNSARKASVSVVNTKQSKSARTTYNEEVTSLDSKLKIAKSNAPLERQAQLLAGFKVDNKKAANPDLTGSEIRKINGQELEEARTRVGASKKRVNITDREWEAIQAGALSQNMLKEVLDNTDLDRIKKLATPRTSRGLSDAKIAMAKRLLASGYTQDEIGEKLGVSASTVANAVKGD